MVRLASIVLVVSACWVAPAPPRAQPLANAVPRTTEPRLPRHTEWLGRYSCAQGWTALHLVVEAREHATSTAVFEFGPLEDNPGVPRGSYKLTGVVRVAPSGALAIDLDPAAWIEQPTGYLMVGLSATTDPERQHLTGTMANPSCGALEATRSD